MNAPSKDMRDYLSLVANRYVSEMPDTPDQCVAFIDTGGYPAEAGYTYERPTIQIMIRGDKGAYQAAYTIAETIRNALHGLANQNINSTRYVGVWAEGDIISLGYDQNHRPLLSVNFRIHRTTT